MSFEITATPDFRKSLKALAKKYRSIKSDFKLEAHAGKVYHLGIGKSVTRSNLSKANEQRDYRIFEKFAYYMIDEARRLRIDRIFEVEGHLYAFDSTTIDLCLSVFEGAKFRKHKGGIKMHTIYEA